MPRPTDAKSSYYPGLDGLRTLAVALVILYHMGISQVSGGLLGVGVFFTLSGFLITGILVKRWSRTNRPGLPTFWMGRIRRLLPAVVLVLVVGMLLVVLLTPQFLGTRSGQALSALFYVANWHAIIAAQSYFNRFAAAGPFDHLWSLAVEEQFYILWPVVLLLVLAITRGRKRPAAIITAVLAAASFVEMLIIAQPGLDNTRAYEGTDTRAGGLLLGAALALWWVPPAHPQNGAEVMAQRASHDAPANASQDARHAARAADAPVGGLGRGLLIDIAGFVGVAGIIALALTTNELSLSLYQWGLLALSICTAAAIVAVCTPGSIASRVFGWTPLRWLGERSYGLYLWHLPVLVFTPEAFLSSMPWLRMGVQTFVIIGLASASWKWVEDPIRRHGFRVSVRDALGRGEGPRHRPGIAYGALMVITLCLTAVLVPQAIVGSADQGRQLASPANPGGVNPGTDSVEETIPSSSPSSTPSAPPPKKSTPATASASQGRKSASASTSAPASAPTPADSASSAPASTATRISTQSRCTKVVYIGDSTSEGLISTDYLPNPADRIDAQLKKFGVTTFYPDISGARSIIEKWKDQPNAQEAAKKYLNQGYDGCWILGLGTNDAADLYTGGADYPTRINLMMDLIPKDQPVMWVNVKTLVKTGVYQNKHSIDWNNALIEAAKKYPNMRIYGWADEVQDKWFIDDKIHFNTPGYKERSRRIAQALANAFPKDESITSDTVVHSS